MIERRQVVRLVNGVLVVSEVGRPGMRRLNWWERVAWRLLRRRPNL